MEDDRLVALRLDVDPLADPIQGRLSAGDGADAHEFTGWLGLAAEIERTLRERRPPPGEAR